MGDVRCSGFNKDLPQEEKLMDYAWCYFQHLLKESKKVKIFEPQCIGSETLKSSRQGHPKMAEHCIRPWVSWSLLSYFFDGTIASLKALAGLIFKTVLAWILIASPVVGGRPLRAFITYNRVPWDRK